LKIIRNSLLLAISKPGPRCLISGLVIHRSASKQQTGIIPCAYYSFERVLLFIDPQSRNQHGPENPGREPAAVELQDYLRLHAQRNGDPSQETESPCRLQFMNIISFCQSCTLPAY